MTRFSLAFARAPLTVPLVTLLLIATAGCSGGDAPPLGHGDAGSDTTADATSDDGAAEAGDDGAIETGDDAGAETSDDAAAETNDDADAAPDAPTDTDDGGTTTPDGGPITSCGPDFDGDGISDLIEGRGAGPGATDIDTDGDGTPDWKDTDSDADGIPDRIEWFTPGCDVGPYADLNDADGDGVPNFRDLDSDGNGLPDQDEACPTLPGVTGCGYSKPLDYDGDGVPDFLDFDNDHDSRSPDKTKGLPDAIEMRDDNGVYKGLAIDTDGDGLPDAYDRDSDNDYILDLDDTTADPDGDGKPAFRDRDADGDGVEDICEGHAHVATAADYDLQTLDTNKNGVPDFLDRDSDGDLLLDGAEDRNANCVVDPSETDRVKADTDGDGVGDLVEITIGNFIGVPTLANDKTKTPENQGQFYFLVPYNDAPSPSSEILSMATTLNKGDIGFVVDTTYSMSGEIANLKSGLQSIINELAKNIPDLGIGSAGHDDVADGSAGACSGYTGFQDQVYYDLPNGAIRDVSIGGVVQTTRVAEAQNAVNALRLGDGWDLPESQIPAMMHALRGDGFAWSGGCGALSLKAATPAAGTIGALGFRTGALPILVEISDANFHGGVIAGGYSSGTFPTIAQLKDAIVANGAKFIGVAAADAATPDSDGSIRVSGSRSAYADMAYLTDNTGSNVPPSAFGGTTCLTGLGGGALSPDGPGSTCRLIFSLRHDGSGLSSSIVAGVRALLLAVKYDVHVAASPAGTTDVVDQFLKSIVPTGTGTDPETTKPCTPIPAGTADKFVGPRATTGTDGTKETMLAVNPGPRYCFDVTPKTNTTIPPTTTAQIFRATLTVWAQNPTASVPAVTLGKTRDVLFIVPPRLN
jgi:hypothetical protein